MVQGTNADTALTTSSELYSTTSELYTISFKLYTTSSELYTQHHPNYTQQHPNYTQHHPNYTHNIRTIHNIILTIHNNIRTIHYNIQTIHNIIRYIAFKSSDLYTTSSEIYCIRTIHYTVFRGVQTRIGGNVGSNDDTSVLVILVGQPIPPSAHHHSHWPGSHQCSHIRTRYQLHHPLIMITYIYECIGPVGQQ